MGLYKKRVFFTRTLVYFENMDDILLLLHLVILGVTALCILCADIYATPWLRGKKDTLDKKIVSRVHTTVTIGLIGMLTTGIFLFLPAREYLVFQSSAFVSKMLFVFALVLNSFVIEKYMIIATQKKFSETTKDERIVLFVSGAISVISWIGAFVSAFFLFS